MGAWRKEWQDFKKQHPKFEQSKNFKSDVGPQMDEFESAVDTYRDTIKTVAKALEKTDGDLLKIKNSLQAAVTGYRKIIDEMQDDKSAAKDFERCLDTGERILSDLFMKTELMDPGRSKIWQNFKWR